MPIPPQLGFVDIHCHLLPAIDDGAKNLGDALEMARIAVRDGIETIVVTPHQLGNYAHNSGQQIRTATAELQRELDAASIPLRLLPGADVRIEGDMIPRLVSGDILSLADQRQHVLLELPHELYFSLTPILQQLRQKGMTGILSHPERNHGILSKREVVGTLVDEGCLMQITASSLTGSMGTACQAMSQWMLTEGLVHFIATDAHGPKTRRPLLRRAYDEVVRLLDQNIARELCIDNPRRVADGKAVTPGRRNVRRKRTSWFRRKAS